MWELAKNSGSPNVSSLLLICFPFSGLRPARCAGRPGTAPTHYGVGAAPCRSCSSVTFGQHCVVDRFAAPATDRQPSHAQGLAQRVAGQSVAQLGRGLPGSGHQVRDVHAVDHYWLHGGGLGRKGVESLRWIAEEFGLNADVLEGEERP